MSAFANLTLQNNAAASVVFGINSIDTAGVAKWMTADSVFDAKQSVTMSVSLPKQGSSVIRVKQKVSMPIMETVDPTKQIGVAYCNIEYVIPKQASSTQRLDLRKFVQTLTADAVTTAAMTNLEGIY